MLFVYDLGILMLHVFVITNDDQLAINGLINYIPYWKKPVITMVIPQIKVTR